MNQQETYEGNKVFETWIFEKKMTRKKKHEKDHFNNVQKYGQLAGPEVEARS